MLARAETHVDMMQTRSISRANDADKSPTKVKGDLRSSL